MQIPNEFKNALERAYHNAGELNKLFVDHKSFIMRLVHHSLRCRHWAVISDEDDLFQEACIWLVDSLWGWDEDKGASLSEYVTYNIGVRLRNHIAKEQRQKRHPKAPPLPIQNRTYGERINQNVIYEERLNSKAPTPEELYILHHAYERIEKELPLLARELLESLMLEDGNFSAASHRVLYGGRVRRVEGMSDDAFRQALNRNILTQLRTILVAVDIIPANDGRL